MRTCLEPFRLHDRRLGTRIIGIDKLDIGLRLGRELNAGIDEFDIEMAEVETWVSDFIMDELDELGIGMFGDLKLPSFIFLYVRLRDGRIGTGIIDGQAWYWND
ncbi:hypothetical protein C2G38_2226254 [Gigaspora rosea]|uniref:Uncharacterized protein n=1 Tax=Gigaspora rosea TaxID=44941 RepID=A0A397U025_9GLOM|nr:hypothetical protein C2G38_2226254 [Gigaspora rosea]